MSYSTTVLADSPLAYWRQGDASGTTMVDSSGNSRDATYGTDATLGATGLLVGDIDTAVAYSGSGTGSTYPTSAASWLGSLTDITLEAWVKTTITGVYQILIDRDDQGGTRQFELRINNVNRPELLVFLSGSGAFGIAPTSGSVVTDGAVHHIVGTVSGALLTLYLDGVQVATSTGSGLLLSGGTLGVGIGRGLTGSFPYVGVLDEAAIYGAALSSTRVAAHYAAGNPTTASGSLSLSGSAGAAAAATAAAGSLTLSGALDNTVAASGTAPLSLSGSGVPTAGAGASASLTLSSSSTPSIPTSTWTGDDEEKFQLPLQWSFIVDVEPVEDPPPTTDKTIKQISVTMPAPTLINGRPQQPWVPTVAETDWAKNLQLIVGGHDRSRPRGLPFIPLSDSDTEPFADADASFAFPGITEFDDPADWGLIALAPVRLRRKDTSNHFHTEWEGDIASVEPDTGSGVIIHCVGCVYRVDLLKEPPDLVTRATDRGHIIARILNRKRQRYTLRINPMKVVTTGIEGVPGSNFSPSVTGAIQDQLTEMTTDSGDQYTVSLARPRTPVLKLKDSATVHATVSYGAPGVVVNTPVDYTAGTTGVFATGSNGHCSWMGARFPNYRGRDVPALPLAPGNVFNPGDGQTGFAPFSNFLRAGDYGSIVSQNTYLAADEDEVQEFQSRAGITVDGIVGAQTWEAAFQPGFNAGSILGAYVDPIYEKPATRKRLYDQFGSDIGPNPDHNPQIPVIQDYIPFGDNVSKALGRKSAKQIVSRNYPAGREGDIQLTSDPAEMSRWSLRSGMNIKVENFNGGHVLLHIIRIDRSRVSGSVSLTVDEKSRDLLTLAAIHQRDKDVADATRRPNFGRTRSKVFNDYGVWLCEDGAGEYPLENLQGGFWNVQQIAAAPKGTIERISFAAGSGLTEDLLDQVLGSTPPSSIPGAARFTVYIFAAPLTANTLERMPGMSTPLTALSDGTNPADANAVALKKLGLIYSAGGPGQACGFYPNQDPGDGSDTHLSGILEDAGGVNFGPTGRYWLWVALWSPVSCKVGGRIFPSGPE